VASELTGFELALQPTSKSLPNVFQQRLIDIHRQNQSAVFDI